MLPRNLVFVRHALSEKNVLSRMREEGLLDDRLLEILRTVPDHRFRLDRKVGLPQTVAASRWLKKNIPFKFDRATYSDAVRAKETGIPIARELGFDFDWREDFRLGERYWGLFDRLTAEEQAAEYEERGDNPRYWTPRGGESLRLVALHARSLFDTLHREQQDMNSILLSHGEFGFVIQWLIEHWEEERMIVELKRGIPNCGIIHYTRVNPFTSEETKSYRWKRRVCPWDLRWKDGQWNGEWTPIVHRTFSLADTEAEVARHPHFLAADRK